MRIPKKPFYVVNAALGLAGVMLIYTNMSFVPTDCISRYVEAHQNSVSKLHDCQLLASTPEHQMACYDSYVLTAPQPGGSNQCD